MNIDKAKKLAFEYAYNYQEMLTECKPNRFEAMAIRPEVHEAIEHIMWMANYMQTFDSLGKVMRWLGFIQGSMWVLGSKSIHELKHENMPLAIEYEIPPSPLEFTWDESQTMLKKDLDKFVGKPPADPLQTTPSELADAETELTDNSCRCHSWQFWDETHDECIYCGILCKLGDRL